ncbi:MAG: exosortase-associated EpsI family protein [Caldilineaceae bacterium]|nr:exosortase-associated EpsI family protein [Caldilineaceae bacterium]
MVPDAPPHTGKARSLLILALFALAIPFVYLPRFQLPWASPSLLAEDNSLVYIADLDFWQRTNRETHVTATAHFDLAHDLNDVPLRIGNWAGIDVPETNQEVMILLEPEQYIQRLYQNSSEQYIWLSMIGGRSSQPFHAPDICYDADGWQYNLGSYPMALADGGNLYGLWLDAKKQMPGEDTLTEHIVYYFYLFPNDQRALNDGIVLFKLTSPRYGTLEETLAIHADFVQQFFTSAQNQSE